MGLVVLVAALQGDAATTLVVGVGVVLAFVAAWRRNPPVAGTLLSLAVTLLATSMLTEWAGERTPLVSSLQSGLVCWLFAVVVVGAVWLAPARVGRNRAVTTALAQAPLVVAAPFVVLAPVAAPLIGLGAAMAVVAWRSRRERTWGKAPAVDRPDVDDRPDVAARARGADRTHVALEAALASGALGTGWAVGGDVEPLLLVGPPGLFVVETRSWRGNVTLVDVGSPAGTEVPAYALDGDARELAARLRPVARTVVRVAASLGVDRPFGSGVVVLWSDTTVPDEQVELTVLTGEGETDGVELVLIRGEGLVDWLRARPTRLDDRQVQRLARRLQRAASSAP